MPDVQLTLLVGTHAQAAALGRAKMTERVREFRDQLPAISRCPIHPGGAIIGRCRIRSSRRRYYPR